LLVVLLSPLQSSAAMMTMREVNTFRTQVALVSDAVEASTVVTVAEKNQMRTMLAAINEAIVLLALQAAANPDAMYQRSASTPFDQGPVFTGNEPSFFSDLIIQ